MTESQRTVRAMRPHRKHSPEFKKEVVDRAKEIGNVAATAAEKDVDKSMIRSWIKAFDTHGLAGLTRKSTRPHRQPRKATGACAFHTWRALGRR